MTFIIRKGTIEDAKGIARVGIRTWQTTYQHIFPTEELNNLSLDKSTYHWENVIRTMNNKPITLFVVVNSDYDIVGFALGGHFEDTAPYDSEIGAIYVLKEFQRRGIGTQLVYHLLQYFQSQGWKNMIIWTLRENPYCKFYEKLNGIVREKKIYEKWNTKHDLLGYVWDNILTISERLQF